MKRIVIGYSLALATAAFALQWLEDRYLALAYPTEVSVTLVAIGFVALGIWIGRRLTSAPATVEFQRNEQAIRSIGLTRRECQLLESLASGQSNKEIGRTFSISPNTVKTHLGSIYEKLAVKRRVQAIEKARCLSLIR